MTRVNLHFTSDPHFGHQLVAYKRGFSCADDHDAAIAANWTEAVAPDDIVYVAGDVALKESYGLEFLAALPGRKRLVLGNHDKAHPMHRHSHRYQRRYLETFESVATSARVRVGGLDVLLSHFPYDGDHTETERHVQWRLPDLGVPLIHGHVHTKQVLTRTALGTPQIHVGLDAWGLKPVPVSQIRWLLA